MSARHKVFLARIHGLDRTSCHFCKNGRMNFRQIDAGAVSVAGSHVPGLNHANAVCRNFQRLRKAGAGSVRMLVGVVDDQPVLFPVHQGIRDFQSKVLLGGFGQCRIDIDVGAAPVGVASNQRRRGGDDRPILLVVPLFESARRSAFHHVQRRRKDFVIDFDRVDRLVGNVLARSGNNGNGRTDFKDFFVEEISVGRAAAQLHVAIFRG